MTPDAYRQDWELPASVPSFRRSASLAAEESNVTESPPKRPSASSPAVAGRPGALRKKDKLLLALHLPVLAVLILPIAPALWSADASLFGLPRSIVTIVGLLCCSFLSVLVHFRSDKAGSEARGDGGGE